LRLLSDALRCIACVAAPCIRPADAGNAARVGFEIVSKAARAGVGERLTPAVGDVSALPLAEGAFDGITSAFALRSFVGRGQAFREMRRVLAPGGRIALLELTVPPNPLLRGGYWLHTRGLGTLLAWLVCGTVGPYRFLLRSVDRFPPAEGILGELAAAGFAEARFRRLSGGVATLYACHAP